MAEPNPLCCICAILVTGSIELGFRLLFMQIIRCVYRRIALLCSPQLERPGANVNRP